MIANEDDRVLILENFKRLDSIGDGRINVTMLGQLLRRCGLNPTFEQLQRFKAEYVLPCFEEEGR